MEASTVAVLKLPAELTIVQLEQCKVNILELIEDNDAITLDDSDVVRIDTLGIQFLLATVTQLSSLNKQLIWQSQSSAVQASVKQLGLNEPILNQYLNV
ncbi:STAS domain-containing protein [Thalassomonas actiniarum]|uniref:STAS domain-containing protein n=1 Tax=Thalassomonas actiniarum TaxID=485447 RepID=A0AAF0C1K9_9GAMM|nr:STAS domain-containing protein [Thalassomonas actiniarum]WDD96865.1 STAS domain-containing protein [Thalassomonas actiniarum]